MITVGVGVMLAEMAIFNNNIVCKNEKNSAAGERDCNKI